MDFKMTVPGKKREAFKTVKRVWSNNNSLLIKYIKDDEHKKIGVIVAFLTLDKDILMGTSICSPKDQFDKDIGRYIAYMRALNSRYLDEPIPDSAKSLHFWEDAFFKLKEKIAKVWGVNLL